MDAVAVGVEQSVVVERFSSRVDIFLVIVAILASPVVSPETLDQAVPVSVVVFYWKVPIGESEFFFLF